MRRLVWLFAIACACGASEGPLLTTRGPKLVAWGASAPRTPGDLDAIAAVWSTSPRWDGVVLSPPGIQDVWSAAPVDPTAALALAPRLANLPWSTLTGNLLSAQITPGDVADEDDAAFAQVVANFATVARTAKALGARGVMLDTQTYFGQPFSFAQSARGRAFGDAQLSLRHRGEQVMRAMLAEHPRVVVVVTIGYAEVWRSVCADGAAIEQDRYGLLPAFLDGMRAALGDDERRQLVDGFLPAYATRSAAAFPFLRAAIGFQPSVLTADPAGAVSHRFPRAGSGDRADFPWVIPTPLACPADVRAGLERPLPVGFGIMIDFRSDPFTPTSPFAGNFHSPEGFAAVVAAARTNADDLVWLFSSQVDWWGRAGATALPAAYRAALE